MLTRTHIVAAAALLGLAGTAPAQAADLDHGFPPGSPYEDRRYSDIYRHPAPPPPPAPRYSQPYYAPPPVYREEQRYAPPPPPYAEPRYRNDGRVAGDCLPRHVIRERLESRGWHDFHDPQVAGNVAHIRARRANGQVFDLTVDRCTGQVLQAEGIDHRSAEAPQPQPQWRYRDDRYRQY